MKILKMLKRREFVIDLVVQDSLLMDKDNKFL